MKFVFLLAVVELLVSIGVNGTFIFIIICDHHVGRIVYVNKKHMSVPVEGCATPSLTLRFYTPLKASSRKISNVA